MSDHKDVFNKIYETNLWGYGSGLGSLPQTTEPYRRFLVNFIKANQIKKILDIGCGDWQFSRLIDWSGIDYTGTDVSSVVLANTMKYAKSGVKFIEANALTDELPEADLVLIKDVIQHWSNADIQNLLPRLKKYKNILITNGIHSSGVETVNMDIEAGAWRSVNLLLEPFSAEGSYVFWYNGGEPKSVFLLNGANIKS
jgi:SAM-dependent methyltransferase